MFSKISFLRIEFSARKSVVILHLRKAFSPNQEVRNEIRIAGGFEDIPFSRWKRKRRNPVIRILPRSQRLFCVVPPVAHCGTRGPLFVMPPHVLPTCPLVRGSPRVVFAFGKLYLCQADSLQHLLPKFSHLLGRGRPMKLRKSLSAAWTDHLAFPLVFCHSYRSRARKVLPLFGLLR